MARQRFGRLPRCGRRHARVRADRSRRWVPVRGFTLLELAIVTVIVGVLASMAAPMVQGVREKALVARAIGDMKAIEIELNQYTVTNLLPPADLAPIERDGMLDPWGNPYAYLAINVGGGGGKGGAPAGARKDKFLVPINSDFDLYSMGPDGQSQPPLSSKAGKDDIIRANDGSFMGIAEFF